jgi:hypothetical protein
VVVQHDCAPSGVGCVAAAPMDVVSDSTDDNGFPFNPTWGWQRLVGIDPAPRDLCSLSFKHFLFPEDDLGLCTPQPTTKNISISRCGSFCPNPGDCGTWGAIPGHVDFTPAQFEVDWVSFPIDGHGEDDDYTIDVARNDRSLLVAGGHVQMEFDSDETIDQFTTPFWTGLHNAVNKMDTEKRNEEPVYDEADGFFHSRPNGRAHDNRAVIVGLLGLDCEHSCSPELHPVYALAVETDTNPDDNVWAFFARNWGDEGYCGTSDRPVPNSSITVRLTQRHATDVEILPSSLIETSQAVGVPVVAMAPAGGAALVQFPLGDSSKKPMIDGELHLRWTLSWYGKFLRDIARVPTRWLIVAAAAIGAAGFGGMRRWRRRRGATERQALQSGALAGVALALVAAIAPWSVQRSAVRAAGPRPMPVVRNLENREPDHSFERALERLPRARREAYERMIATSRPPVQRTNVQGQKVERIAPTSPATPRVVSVPDPEHEAKLRRRLDALREVLGAAVVGPPPEPR